MKVLPEHEKSSNGPPGSKERSLFDNSMEVSLSPEFGMMTATGHAQENYFFIGRPFCRLIIHGCIRVPERCRYFVGSDDEAMKYSNVIVMNARLKGTTFFIDTIT